MARVVVALYVVLFCPVASRRVSMQHLDLAGDNTALFAESKRSVLNVSRIGGDPLESRPSCIGSFLGSAGNCTEEIVINEYGTELTVQPYCYDIASPEQDSKASWNDLGMCYIPRTKPCESSYQCRPGTFCIPQGEGGGYHCLQKELDTILPSSGAARTARLVQEMCATLSQETMHVSSAVNIHRSGIYSPFAKSKFINPVLDQIGESFQTAYVKEHSETSRSGAAFVYSGNKRFIAKTIRDYEYDAFIAQILDGLEGHVNLNEFDCAAANAGAGADPVGNCWAAAALARTSLNLPLLAYMRMGEYWVVLPVVSALRAYASPAVRLGEPKYFDVKPVWAHSNQRAGFFRYLAEAEFLPGGSNKRPGGWDKYKEVTNHWEALRSTVRADVLFLSNVGGSPFVDYSFLFDVYTPNERVTSPGPGCVPSPACFGRSEADLITPCRVLCVTIIDFFLAYDTVWKRFESSLIHSKWDRYIRKVWYLMECVGDPSAVRGQRINYEDELNDSGDYERLLGKRGSTYMPVVEWSYFGASNMTQLVIHRDSYSSLENVDIKCASYLEMACRDSFYGVFVSATPTSSGSELRCTFTGTGARARTCRAHLFKACERAAKRKGL